MSQKITHDSTSNTLHIIRQNTEQATQEKPQSLRGFVVNIADNEEKAQQFRENGQTEVQLMPLLAHDENEAINFVKSQGKVPLSITPYEYLKFQTNLLEQLALQEKITLLNEDLNHNEN